MRESQHKTEINCDNLNMYGELANLSWRKDSVDLVNINERQMSQQMDVVDDYIPYDLDKLRKYSADDGMLKEPELRKRTLSMMMERINGKIK